MAMKLGELEVDITADTSGLDRAEKEVRKSAKATETVWQRTGGRVTDQFLRMGHAAKRMAGNIKITQNQAQQAAFQIQDFSGQVANGTNAMVAFSQQAPQLLGAFGPGGAVAGAIVGVASAIGASLIPALFSSTKEVDQLTKATDELDDVLTDAANGGVTVLTEKIVELAAESKDAALIQIQAGLVRALDDLGQAAKDAGLLIDEVFGSDFGRTLERGIEDFSMVDTIARDMARSFGITTQEALKLFDAVEKFREEGSIENLDALQRLVNEIAVSSQTATPELAKFAAALSVSTDSAQTATENIEVLKGAQTDLAAAVDTATEALTREERAFQERQRRMQEMRRQREEERRERAKQADLDRRGRGIQAIELLGESSLDRIGREAKERREFILQQDQITAQERQRLLDIVQADREDKVRAHNERIAELEASANERQAAVAAAQQTAALTGLATLADRANDILVSAGQEGTAISKAIFLAQKAIQVASIIAATEVAAANAAAVSALGGPFAYLATASGIRTLGYANAALVAGLAVGETFRGGGRQFGGTTSPMMAHPINEAGVPEILNTAGRQFLLPTGQGGTITPMKEGHGQSGQPSVTIISNGTPQTITGAHATHDEVAVMIDDRVRASERRQRASLATGRGDMAQSLQAGWRVERRL